MWLPRLVLKLTLLLRQLFLLSLLVPFSLSPKVNPNWDRCHGDRSVSQYCSRDLVAPAAYPVGTPHYGSADDPADSDRHVTDHPPLQENGYSGVGDHPKNCRNHTVCHGPHKRRVLVCCQFGALVLDTADACHGVVYPIVRPRDRLLAELAPVLSWTRVSNRTQLRCTLETGAHHGRKG